MLRYHQTLPDSVFPVIVVLVEIGLKSVIQHDFTGLSQIIPCTLQDYIIFKHTQIFRLSKRAELCYLGVTLQWLLWFRQRSPEGSELKSSTLPFHTGGKLLCPAATQLLGRVPLKTGTAGVTAFGLSCSDCSQ